MNIPSHWKLTPVKGKAAYIKDWRKNPLPLPEIQRLINANSDVTGMGVLLGEMGNGIVAVDIDGSTALAYVHTLGELPKTVISTSGKHDRSCFFYQIPPDLWECITHKSIPTGENENLELRWTGQQVIPPSIHPDTGKPYQWINSPDDCDVAIASDWLIQAMAIPEPEPVRERQPNFKPSIEEIPLVLCIAPKHRELIESGRGQGGRDNAGAGLIRDLMGTAEFLKATGQRFHGDPYDLLSDYCSRCDPPLTQKDCDRIYKSAQKSNPTPCLDAHKIEKCVEVWHKKNQPKRTSNVVPIRKEQPKSDYQAPEQSEESYQEPQGKIPAFTRILRGLTPLVEGKLKYNLLTQEIEYLGQPLNLEDFRSELMRSQDGRLSLSPSDEYFNVMKSLAKDNSYHPVKQYLQGVHGKHLDEVSSMGVRSEIFISLLEKGLGVPFTQLYGVFIRRWLVNAVARAMTPGCEVHEVLVLQGTQGSQKTSFGKNLCDNQSWFTSSLTNIGTNKSFMVMNGKWIVEMPELERFTSTKAGDGELKNFISNNVDTYIVPYGRSPSNVPRSSIFLGTVNRVDFLKDPTGSRRFWIIPKVECDLDWVRSNRDLLWAAAFAEYQHEPEMNSSDRNFLKETLSDYNASFEAESAWEETISNYLQGRTKITSSEILTQALKFDISKITPVNQAEVSTIMHKLKWIKGREKHGGRYLRCWFSPENQV